jgi:hypothetical protein
MTLLLAGEALVYPFRVGVRIGFDGTFKGFLATILTDYQGSCRKLFLEINLAPLNEAGLTSFFLEIT